MFRVGSGLGHALYCEDNAYGKAAFIAMDIQRAAGLFGLFGGAGARFANSPAGVALNSKLVKFSGREIKFGNDFRVSPFGNRTTPPHPIGKWPHYHRQGPKFVKGNRKGQSMPGQSMRRHRPWEGSPFDKSFWDRF